MARAKIKETEYIYASARVHAAMGRLIGADKLEAAISAKDASEAEALLGELGGEDGGDKFSAALASAYNFIESVTPVESVLEYFRHIYDCNNIKAALKCHIRGIEPEEMLFSFGKVSIDEIKKMPSTLDFSALPENMREGAREAYDAFVKTKNPQLIDIILDKACFADMLAAAQKSGDDFLVELARTKIDLTNITMSIRSVRMGGGYNEIEVLSSSLVDGGNIGKEKLLEASKVGEDDIAELLYRTPYASLGTLIEEKASLSRIECECDNIYMKLVRQTKYVPFGASVLCAFLIATEYQLKNLRMILAGKKAGLSADTIRERVRLSYV